MPPVGKVGIGGEAVAVAQHEANAVGIAVAAHANDGAVVERDVERRVGNGKVDGHAWRRAQLSSIATQRVQPADAASIFTGKQATLKPNGGSWSRLVSFSMWQ